MSTERIEIEHTMGALNERIIRSCTLGALEHPANDPDAQIRNRELLFGTLGFLSACIFEGSNTVPEESRLRWIRAQIRELARRELQVVQEDIQDSCDTGDRFEGVLALRDGLTNFADQDLKNE